MVPSPSIAASPPAVREVEVGAADGATVAVRLFEPARSPQGTLVVHGATAAPQRYYARFAEHVATRGWRVITYDYRGVGRSRPASLRGFEATMRDWAELDARAVLAWAARRFPGPRASIGHSFGGQLVGLIDEAHAVDRAIMVGSQLGYYRHWRGGARIKLGAIWLGLVPALTATFGYLPGRAGLGEDLPRGVAREWATWCTSPNYLLDHVDGAAERMARFDAPTLFYSFTDDEFAPQGAVDALLERLPGAPLTHRRISPADLGLDRIGHFGFFRPEHRDTLWDEALDFLTGALVRRAA